VVFFIAGNEKGNLLFASSIGDNDEELNRDISSVNSTTVAIIFTKAERTPSVDPSMHSGSLDA
jgi:hypothetical protein